MSERDNWELLLPSMIEPMYKHRPFHLKDFLQERDVHMAVNNKRWNLLGPLSACSELEFYGASTSSIRDSESKRACGLQKLPTCVVLSIGSNGQWEFEKAIISSTNCTVHTFDCTISNIHPPPSIRSRTILHNLCLGSSPPRDRNYFLEVPRKNGRPGAWKNRQWKYSQLKESSFKNYSELVRRAGLSSAPSLLKMDIEGYEWQTIPSIVSSTLAPKQIAVEMHFQTQMPGLSWFGRYKSPVEILAFGNMMHKRGYRIASRQDNPACKWCTEILWIK